jgi:hypothetical protein
MRRAAIGFLTLVAAVATALAAQDRPKPKPPAPPPANNRSQRCLFQIENVDRQGKVEQTPTGTNYFAGGNVRLRCKGTAITMRSDSVAAFGGTVVKFIGHVRYRDSTLTMDADFGTYYKAGERWEARGHVVTQNLHTGSKLTGPSLDYLRELSGVRDTLEMYAVKRPKIEYATPDSTGKRAEPYLIVADRVRFKGSDRVWAGGTVTIDRSDFAARGDSLRLDTGKGSDGTLLGQSPELRGTKSDSFSLRGNRIDFQLDRRALTYVTAKGAAHAVSNAWNLVADTIALDVNDGAVEYSFAWGKTTQPSATSTNYAVKADSLAFDTPAQKLREIRSFGRAWLGGDVDSASGERNWMRGDTLVAAFAQEDSAGTKRTALHRIEARRTAQSYHVDPNAKFPTKPSIDYSRGDAITLTMRTGEKRGVDRVEIKGEVEGLHLEAAATPADTTGARPTGNGKPSSQAPAPLNLPVRGKP